MPKNSSAARREQARALTEAEGIPYTEALRRLDAAHTSTTANGGECEQVPFLTEHLDALGGARVPAPVAVMMARHLYAARLHVSFWHGLAVRAHVPEATASPERNQPQGALDAAYEEIGDLLSRLGSHAERTALASEVIPALPAWIGQETAAQAEAKRLLYPGREEWCYAEGRTLPQPGEEPGWLLPPRTRHLLTGPVPAQRMTAHADGSSVKVRDVVPGSPAAHVWDAVTSLQVYTGEQSCRRGDSPADLAAALDGVIELAAALQNAAEEILGEAADRADEGTLQLRYRWDKDGTSGQMQRPTQAADRLDTQAENLQRHFGQIRDHLNQARESLTGARASWSASQPDGEPVAGTRTARSMDGRSAAAIREELGSEVLANRQISKTGVPDGRRARVLARILNWLHATDRTRYSVRGHYEHGAV